MKEKIVFVTGANKGIGFGIPKPLSLSGLIAVAWV